MMNEEREATAYLVGMEFTNAFCVMLVRLSKHVFFPDHCCAVWDGSNSLSIKPRLFLKTPQG